MINRGFLVKRFSLVETHQQSKRYEQQVAGDIAGIKTLFLLGQQNVHFTLKLATIYMANITQTWLFMACFCIK